MNEISQSNVITGTTYVVYELDSTSAPQSRVERIDSNFLRRIQKYYGQ